MSIISILICLGLDRYVAILGKLRCYQWFTCYLHLLKKWLGKLPVWRNWLGLLVIFVPVIVIVSFIQILFNNVWHGILGFIFNLFILYYCLDSRDLVKFFAPALLEKRAAPAAEPEQSTQTEVEADTADAEPELIVQSVESVPVEEVTAAAVAAASERAVTESAGEAEVAVEAEPEPQPAPAEVIMTPADALVAANRNVFGVIFWFLIFGAMGALIYRLAILLKDIASSGTEDAEFFLKKDESGQVAKRNIYITGLAQILDWVPVRIVSLFYSLIGDFAGTFSCWLRHVLSFTASSADILTRCGMAATGLSDTDDSTEAVDKVNRLNLRALVVVLALVAIMTIVSWVN